MANLIKMRSMTVRSSTPNEWLLVVIVIIGYPVARRYLDVASGINYILLSITPKSTIWYPNRIDKHKTKRDTAFLYMKSQHQCVFVCYRAPVATIHQDHYMEKLFLTYYAVNNWWWEIACKNNWRIACPNASTARYVWRHKSAYVILWWRLLGRGL